MQYTVQPGDTLFKIAQMFNTTIERILELNPAITNPNLIYVGQVIVIDESVGPEPCPPGNLLINSSFENWPDPTLAPRGWQINNVYRSNLSNFGRYAAELGAAVPNRQATLSQTVAASVGRVYQLEFYVRENQLDGGISQYQLRTQVIFYNELMEVVGQVDTVISQTAIPKNTFQLYTLTTDPAPGNTARAEVRSTFIPDSRNDNTIIIDNVVFYCLR